MGILCRGFNFLKKRSMEFVMTASSYIEGFGSLKKTQLVQRSYWCKSDFNFLLGLYIRGLSSYWGCNSCNSKSCIVMFKIWSYFFLFFFYLPFPLLLLPFVTACLRKPAHSFVLFKSKSWPNSDTTLMWNADVLLNMAAPAFCCLNMLTSLHGIIFFFSKVVWDPL